MIDKVLQRSYVLSRAEQLATSDAAPQVPPPDDLVADPDELDDELRASLSDEELADAADALRNVARTARKPR